MSGRPSPARTFPPVSGSRTSTERSCAITIGSLQVLPWSVERITACTNWFGDGCTPEPRARLKTSTSVPSGSTAIWLPIVNRLALRLRMSRGVDQVAPASVVRDSIGSPRNANECSALKSAFSPGLRLRSQTAYTRSALVGSAVIDSLSLKLNGDRSEISVVGSPHVSPPSVDLLTRMAEVSRSALAERLIWYASPLGANVTHGSEARS